MTRRIEILEGFVVDIRCVRLWPHDEVRVRAREHARECLLKGAHMETGYALITDEGSAVLLDTDATPLIIDVLQQLTNRTGICVRAEREWDGERMKTVLVLPGDRCSTIEDTTESSA
jgi:hypothetical protein